MLSRQEYSFEQLRQELQLSVRELEDHLRHLERSVRRGDDELKVIDAKCLACEHVFRGRTPKRFSTPGRCPRCRSERVLPARLRIES